MKSIYILSILIFLVGCTALEIKIPVASIKSPEVVREHMHQLNFVAVPTKTFTVTSNINIRPLAISNEVTDSSYLSAEYNYGVVDYFTLGAAINSDGGSQIQLQYQFLNDVVEDIGWSAALQFGLNCCGSRKKGVSDTGLQGPGTYESNGELSLTAFNPSVSAGYRFNKNIMGYFGISYSSFSVVSKIQQSASTDGLDFGGSFNQSNSGSSQSLGAGLQFDLGSFHLKPSAQWTEFHLAGQNKQSMLSSLTVSFNR